MKMLYKLMAITWKWKKSFGISSICIKDIVSKREGVLWYLTPLSTIFKLYHAELQISCVFAFFTLWKRVKTHVLSDQSVHITHTYCCVSKLSKFGVYLYSRVHNNTFLSEKFHVITSLYTFRRRERIHPRGTECLPF
jgi:hypothetical protein